MDSKTNANAKYAEIIGNAGAQQYLTQEKTADEVDAEQHGMNSAENEDAAEIEEDGIIHEVEVPQDAADVAADASQRSITEDGLAPV